MAENQLWCRFVWRWMKPQRNQREFRFVVCYRDSRIADGLLRVLEEYLAQGEEENHSPRPPLDRRSIQFDQRKGQPIFDLFLDSEWYPGVLHPNVYIDGSGQRLRDIQNMVDGEVQRVKEDDFVYYEWVPEFDEDDLDYVVRRRIPSTNVEKFHEEFSTGVEFSTVRRVVAEKTQWPEQDLELSFNGNLLLDTETLKSANVEAEGVIDFYRVTTAQDPTILPPIDGAKRICFEKCTENERMSKFQLVLKYGTPMSLVKQVCRKRWNCKPDLRLYLPNWQRVEDEETPRSRKMKDLETITVHDGHVGYT